MKYILFSILLFSILSLTACSNQDSQEPVNKKELLISSAASLSNVMTELVDTFEEKNPTITISLNFGGSGKLAQQIQQGAPVDVFLSADQKWMDMLDENQLIVSESRVEFAENELVLVGSGENDIKGYSVQDIDFNRFDQIAIGNPDSVPAGSYAKEVLDSLGIWENIQEKLIYAKDVQQVLTYVESQNTDIGFVYESDLYSSGINKITTIDQDWYSPIVYPAAIMATSNAFTEAESFISFLKTDQAQAILQNHGFYN
ncbi:molybdate ABC transporter substrate-binding protein [Virgibacillus byunsanensis]|uniref:Molybdate ABC transporter substrate-binding protein n=1 Tax=Virgibacillus byunsanensis TaxID=570945 RepID=A0ABW3LPE7_9BACI